MSIKYIVTISDSNYEREMAGMYEGEILTSGMYGEDVYDGFTLKKAQKFLTEKRKEYAGQDNITIYCEFYNTNDSNNDGFYNPIDGHSPCGQNWNNLKGGEV